MPATLLLQLSYANMKIAAVNLQVTNADLPPHQLVPEYIHKMCFELTAQPQDVLNVS